MFTYYGFFIIFEQLKPNTMKNLKTLSDEEFDALDWKVEQEENDVFLFYPENEEELFTRYNSYKELFLDRNFNPNGYQTQQLQRLLSNHLESKKDAFDGLDGYTEYGVKESDFFSN